MFDEHRCSEHAQNRCFAIWLTEDEYESFVSDWESQQKVRQELKDKPDELRWYENELHQATFNDNKAGRVRKGGNKGRSTKFRNLNESQCEDTLKILQEIVDADASLDMWFDRGLDFVRVSLVDAQLGNLLRIVTSRSIDRQATDSWLMSRREVKTVTVEIAMSVFPTVEVNNNKERK